MVQSLLTVCVSWGLGGDAFGS